MHVFLFYKPVTRARWPSSHGISYVDPTISHPWKGFTKWKTACVAHDRVKSYLNVGKEMCGLSTVVNQQHLHACFWPQHTKTNEFCSTQWLCNQLIGFFPLNTEVSSKCCFIVWNHCYYPLSCFQKCKQFNAHNYVRATDSQ